MARLIRSNKYQTLSDRQILQRMRNDPAGEALHFLTVEIQVRDLDQQFAEQVQEQQKKSRHSIFYYLFYLFLAMLFLGRFGSSLF